MRRLRVRLLLSHLAVAVIGAVVTVAVVVWSAPTLFDEGVSGLGPGFRGGPGGRLRDVFAEALRSGLVLGVSAALLVAVFGGWFVARRVLRPLDDVRDATRRIAAGEYRRLVPRPADLELAALADDVNAMARALDETETRRVRLLGEVAHEMRTPLTVLTGRVEGLADGVFEVDDALLAELTGELSRLRRLADDLSELSRVEEGRLGLRPVAVDLGALLADVGARWQRLLADTDVDLVVEPSGSLSVAVDPDRVAQVLDNLVGNADGPGDTGSGIGLTVSRGIARAHGGELVARSDGPGHGATFVLTLPRH